MTCEVKKGLGNFIHFEVLRGEVRSLHFLNPDRLNEEKCLWPLLVALCPCVCGSYLPVAPCQVAPAPKSDASTKEANLGVQTLLCQKEVSVLCK